MLSPGDSTPKFLDFDRHLQKLKENAQPGGLPS